MRLGWKVGWPICTAGSTAALIERNHREGCTFRNRMAGNGRSGSRRWRTRLFNRPWSPSSQIYEEDFRGFSYGFRPGRSQHQALDALYVAITRKKVNWILDCDIRGFFDNLSHDWLLKFVQHRVADRRILRLIQKWLKAGVMEEGEWKDTGDGYSAGIGGFAVACKHLSALRVRPVGGCLAQEARAR